MGSDGDFVGGLGRRSGTAKGGSPARASLLNQIGESPRREFYSV